MKKGRTCGQCKHWKFVEISSSIPAVAAGRCTCKLPAWVIDWAEGQRLNTLLASTNPKAQKCLRYKRDKP